MTPSAHLHTLIASHLGIPAERISDDAFFGADLGCDSLDTVELSMLAEEALGITLSDDEALDAFALEKRVGDAVGLVERKLAERVG